MELRELGLTDYEAKAYTALVKRGKSPASKVSSSSGVPYGKIYEVLSSLEEKGLVTVIPEKTKLFVASDPKNLSKLIDKKERCLKNLKIELENLKKFYDTQEKEVVEIGKGDKNFYKLLKKMVDPNEFSYSIKWDAKYRPDWATEFKEWVKKGVEYKTLTRYDEETKKEVKKWFKITQNIKQIENRGIAISINEKEVLISLIKKNTTLLIRDQNLSDMLKKLFSETYKNAKKIE